MVLRTLCPGLRRPHNGVAPTAPMNISSSTNASIPSDSIEQDHLNYKEESPEEMASLMAVAHRADT
jgi:hypothetical protein